MADRCRAAISREVGGLRIHQHRNRQSARLLNYRLADLGREDALGVVRKHHGVAAGQVRKRSRDQLVVIPLRPRAHSLRIQPQHLLPSAHDALLGDCWKTRRNLKLLRDALGSQTLGQQPLVVVASRKADDCSLRAQPRQVHCYVGRATGLPALVRGAHHRDRRLGRDSSHLAPYVFVEHHVAHHQQAFRRPVVLNFLNDGVQVADWLAHLATSVLAASAQ